MSATCGTPIFTYHGAGYQNGYDEQNGYQPYYYNLSVPQVAGIVALVQSVAFADKRIGKPLPPRYLRQLLVRTAHELPLNDPDKPIGKYPDAGAAVEGLMQDLADGTLQRAFEEAGWPSDPDTPETSEPITGNVTIPGEVDAGETFTVSIDAAQSTSGKALSYEWKWMGVVTKPEGDKFIAQGSNKAPSMTIKAGEFDDDVPAYIRVVVSDGENERSFMQDVRIKAKRANLVAYTFGTNYKGGDRVTHEGRVFECKPAAHDASAYNSWCGTQSEFSYEPGKGVFWKEAWTEVEA
jgi:hypothetical protein